MTNGCSAFRPALSELNSESSWFEWANPGPERLPALPTFNAFGDLGAQAEFCIFFGPCVPLGERIEYGDGLLPAGTNSPFDVPSGGGSRFLNGSLGTQNWQWNLSDTTTFNRFEPDFGIPDTGWLLAEPAFHANLESSMKIIQVPDCRSHVVDSLLKAVTNVIDGRMTGIPHLCVPNPGT